MIGPEVYAAPRAKRSASTIRTFIDTLQKVDALIIAGQAKSHCVAWTISDLLEDIQQTDPRWRARSTCWRTAPPPVVVPGADFTEAGDGPLRGFAEAGMHRVKSTDPSRKLGRCIPALQYTEVLNVHL